MRALYTAVAVVLVLGLASTGVARATHEPDPSPESAAADLTPPRLSYVDGQVSFWRPGAPEWVAAQVNTPLAPGDELSTGSPGNLEIQVGPRAFVRAWGGTALGLVNLQQDFLQVKVTAGYATLDLRALDPGQVVELDTPSAAFTIQHPGYYRVRVDGDRTSLIARRGGRASVTAANAQAASLVADGEVIVDGDDPPRLAMQGAPAPDEWDRWNDARSDYLADSVSARYVSAGVYGVSDLDRFGGWRTVPEYGAVWVPASVPGGWTPYSTGSWTWDPSYGWTWVDTAPWGWAPFHYGRWVYVNRFWAWAPGPPIVRPAYAPALVAFFGGTPTVSVRVGWVPLGWGEPVVPWWGRPRFVGVPWWGGWGGPRVVNNVVIHRTAVVPAHSITTYRNVRVHNAVVAVESQRFGRGGVAPHRLAPVQAQGLQPVRGRLEIAPVPASLTPTLVQGVRPSDNRHERSVVATRPPHRIESVIEDHGRRGSPREAAPAPRLVPPPPGSRPAVESPRPNGPRPEPPAVRGPEGPPRREPRLVTPAPQPQPGTARPQGTPRSEPPRPQGPPRVDVPRQPETPRVEPPRPQAPPRVDVPRQPETPRVEPRRPQAPPREEHPRPQEPRIEAPHPQGPSRGQHPRQEAPRIEAPRPQGPPRVDVPRPQGPPPSQPSSRIEAPRPQAPVMRPEAPRPQGRPAPGGGGDAPDRTPDPRR